MKKHLLSSLVLATVVLTAYGSVVSATDYEAKTDTDVKFKAATPGDTTNTPVKPGTDIEIELPSDANSTEGDLRIEYVPAIHFGEIEIAPTTKEYQAKYTTYLKKGVTPVETVSIPHFVQVTDARGTGAASNKWKLSVEQTDVFKAASGEKLENTRIFINQQTIINNVSATLADKLTGVGDKDKTATDFTDQFIGVKAKSEAPLVVLGAKETVDTSISSNVFFKGYAEANFTTEDASLTNPGVTLKVKAGDNPLATKTYEAKLEWTLTDTY